jgi:hypothetical protein
MNKQSITIRGRKFDVTLKSRVNNEGKAVRYFELKGARGAEYFTMTNVHSGLHFVCNARRVSAMPFDGVWLKDNDGVLEVLAE